MNSRESVYWLPRPQRRVHHLYIVVFGLLLSLCVYGGLTTTAYAENLTIVHQAKDTGSGPFDTFGTCPALTPGDDCSATDNIVRTNDIVAYLWSVSTGSTPETNVTLVGTIEPGMTWQSPIPAPCTGPGSGISADGLTLTCIIPSITPDTSLDILPVAKVDYDSEDGESITAGLTVSSDDCPPEDADDVTVDVSASPQLDLEKLNPGNGGIYNDPVTGEPGIVYYYPVSILMANGGKGNEIVSDTITFTDDLSGYPAGSQLFNWSGFDCGYNDQYYSHNGIPRGVMASFPPDRSVTDSGTWACVDNGGSIGVTITGADLTGQHVPIEDRDGTVLAADKAYVVAGIMPIWVPIQAIKDAGGLSVTNVVGDFDPDSISGASNYQDGEEPLENNDYTHYIPAGSGSFQKYFQKRTNHIQLDGQTTWKAGDGIVGPGQDFRARIYARNTAILPWENFVYCDKIDLTRYYLDPDGSGDATSFSVHSNPVMPLTEGTDFVVEYGSVPSQANSDCADATSTGGWHASTNAYIAANPGATVVDDINAVRVVFLTDFQPQQKFSLYLDVTARVDVPNGDILPNHATYQTDTLNNGNWRIDNFDPINYTSIGLGDRATMSRGSVRITKDSNPTEVDAITAGDPISYRLRWTATSETSADILDMIITDTLPAELTYTGATVTPTTVTVNADGTTTLVWEFGDIAANTSGNIYLDAVSDQGIPNLRDKINSVIISSPTDASPDEFREDEYTIKILNFAAMQTRKTTSTPLIGTNEPFQYTIFYRNVGQQYFPEIDIIDVFPYNGDGRTPPTSYNGTIALTGVAPSSTGTMYYSNATPGSISNDPAAGSNALGAGSIWCELSDLGVVAGCPAANFSDVTAIRFTDEVLFPAFDPIRNITLDFTSNGNLSGDIYTNSFSARAEGLTLPVESNDVPVRVSASAFLDITKVSDIPGDSCIEADSDITYTIVLTNIGRGVACLSDFVDTIPMSSTFVSGSLFVDGTVQADPTGGDVTFPLTGSGAACSDGTNGFDIGESMTVQFTVSPDPNYLGDIVNQASVEGIRDINGNAYPDVPDNFSSIDPTTLEDDTVVCTTPQAPDINLIKNNDANQDGTFTDSELYIGALPINVTYDIVIENDSVSDMTITSIGDDTHAIGASCSALLGTVVPGNGSVSCQFDVLYTEDNQSVVNVFSVEAENEGGTDEDDDPSTVTIPNINASINLEKEADKSVIYENGEDVEFTIVVRNTSIADTVTINEVVDSVFGDVSGSCTPTIPADLEPNETITCTFTEFVSGNAGDVHENIATANGQDDDGNDLTDSDDEEIPVLDRPSEIKVTKLADPVRVMEPGEDVLFTVQVENLSAADTVTITSVIDSVFGDVSADCAPAIPAVLAPNETVDCEFTRFIGDNAGDVHTNVVTAEGTDDDGNDLSDDDDAQVDVDNVPSAIRTTKVASPTTILENSDDVQFIITVENISTVDPVTITTVTDDIFGDITQHCAPTIPAMIMPGELITCTFTETISGNAGDQHLNVVTAEGYDDDGDEPSDDDDATVDIVDVPSSMEVTKIANPTQVFELGDMVTFTVGIRNTSPSDTITVTTVTDSVFGDISGSCAPSIPAVLLPDETISCSFTEMITGNAGFVHENTVTAEAVDDDGNDLDDEDDATVELLDVPSAIEVTKLATPDTLLEESGDVTFTITVANVSLVDTVYITSVVDTVFGDISASCGGLPATLLVGETLTCTFTEELVGEAWDVHENTVTADGYDDDDDPVSDDDDEEVTFENVPSSIDVTKVASPTSVPEPGGDVDFTVTVQNTSLVDTVTITNVVDSVFGDISADCGGLPVDLEPDEVLTCTFTEYIAGEAFFVHENTVTAEGVDDDGEPVEDDDDATVDVTNIPPSIEVIKVANPTSVDESGENVTFTVTIENTSIEDDVTIETVVDDMFGDITSSCTPAISATIVPGEMITCTFVEFIEGDIEIFHQNTVTAEGTSDDGEPVDDDDDAKVTYDDETPLLDVQKVANVQSIPEPEGEVEYTVTVENQSAADTITVTTVTDNMFGDISASCLPAIPAIIAPTEMITCVFTETITGNALDVHENTVTASGIDDDGTPVEDDDDEDVAFTDVPSSIMVVKTADPVVVMELGGDVTFTVDVINTSAVDVVTITQVIDNVFGDVSASCPNLPQPLAPNESLTCTFVEFIAGNAGYHHNNIVTATGYDNDGDEPTDDDDADVDVLNVPSSMQVTKVADPIVIYELSDTVTFTIEVLNTSAVDTITVTQVVDSVFGDISGSCAEFPAVLAPNDSVMCVFTETIAGNAGYVHTNTVTADAVDDDGDTLEEDDDARVDVLNVPSDIEIIKTASTGAILEPGADVTFTFTINNLSSLDVITVTEVVDNVFGDISGGCEHAIPYAMAPLESMTCTVVEYIAGNSGDVHENTATVSGVDDDGDDVSDDDDEDVEIENVPSSMDITKEANPIVVYERGDDVEFTVVVWNTSPVDTITVTQVVDDVFGDISAECDTTIPAQLGVGEFFTCTFTRFIAGNAGDQHHNTVTASATDDDGESLEDEDDAFVDILDLPSSIETTKTANPSAILEPGADVTFEIVTVNTSAADAVTITNVTDSVFGDVSASCLPALPAQLAPNEVVTCSFTEFIAGNAGDLHENTVTASATDDDGNDLTDSDDEEVPVENVGASIRVTKVADPIIVAEPGGDVEFTIVVANDSPADPVTVNTVNDDIFGDISASCEVTLPHTLQVGESFSCVFTEMISGNAGDTHLNVVTAEGVSDDGEPVSDDDEATVGIYDIPSTLNVTKNATPNSVPEPGGDVTFTIEVYNGSPVDTVDVTSVVDSVFGDISASCEVALPHALPASQSFACTFSEFVSANAGDIHENTVTVQGTDDDGNPLEDSDDEIVPTEDVESEIRVTKTADPILIPEPAADVAFTVLVENASPSDPVTINTVTDDVFGDISADCAVTLPHTLAVGESFTCVFTEEIAGNAGDQHVNVVTATGTDDDGNDLSDDDDAVVDIYDVESELVLVKQADKTMVTEPGEDVRFTIVVKNPSDADSVTVNEVVDSVFGDVSASCEHDLPYTLTPDEEMTCAFTEFVSANAGDIHENTATANGVDDDGNDLSASDDEEVGTEDTPSSIDVVKTADQTILTEPGGDVAFTITVENTSDVDDMTINEVVDSVFGDVTASCGTMPRTLAPAEMLTCTFTEFVGGNAGFIHENTATANGTDDDGNPVSDSDDETVVIEDTPAEIDVVKTASVGVVDEPGADVTFTVTVKNISVVDDVTIETVTDSVFGDVTASCGTMPATLAPSEMLTCTFTEFVGGNAGDIHENTATADGTDDDGNPVSDDDDEQVLIESVPSSIDVTKVANISVVNEPGGDVEFTITVENTSDVDDVTINEVVDSVFGDVTASCGTMPATLAPSETLTCTFTEFIAGNGGDTHENVATANGVDDDGTPVTDSDDEQVLVDNVPSSIDVVKTADIPSVQEPGGDVEFTITAENTSSVDDVTITEVIDSVFGDVTASCGTMPRTLAPAETMACTFTEFVAGNGGDIHLNVATANGVDDDGDAVTDSDNEQVAVTEKPDDPIPPVVDVVATIDVVKTARTVVVDEPGADVTFDIVVENTSTIAVTIEEVVDNMFGDVTASCGTMPRTLAPAETMTCTFTEFIGGNAGDTHVNVATANGTAEDGDPVSDNDDENVLIEGVPSSINVVKTANVSEVSEPGGMVTFDVVVVNTSAVDDVTIETVTDSMFGDISASCGTLPVTLAPSETLTCTFSEMIEGAAGDVHNNIATASGTDDDGTPLSDSDDENVLVANTPSSINVVKTANLTQIDAPGQDVIFTVTVENTSAVDDVTITEVVDSVFGDVTAGCGFMPRLLLAGETMVCTFTEFVAGDHGTAHINVATANGVDDDGEPVTDSDREFIVIDGGEIIMDVTKSAAVERVEAPGEDVEFTVTVVNNSTADFIFLTSIVDDVYGEVCANGRLVGIVPGGQYSCTFTGFVSGNDGDMHHNTVTVNGSDFYGNTLQDADDETVQIGGPEPTEPPVVTPEPTEPPVVMPEPTEPPVVTPEPTETPEPPVTTGGVTGSVMADSDGDGVGDTPLGGVTLELYADGANPETAEPIATVTTDENGAYNFENVPTGEYFIQEVQPFGYDDVSEQDGGTDGDHADNGVVNMIPVTVSDGETDAGNDFVEAIGSNEVGGVTGSVLADSDGDGVGDTPLGGVTLELYSASADPDSTGPLQVVTTDENGMYSFDNLPVGDYIIREIQPVAYDDVSELDGGDDGDNSDNGIANLIPVTISSGETDTGNDFVDAIDPSQIGMITGSVMEDSDQDGIGDTPLAGVTLELYADGANPETAEPIAIVTTDENGSYQFENIPTGDYFIQEVQPFGYDNVSEQDGGTDGDHVDNGIVNMIPVTVDGGEMDAGNDFIDTPTLIVGAISGVVLNDTNEDGVGDEPLAGVRLQLYPVVSDPDISTGLTLDIFQTIVTDENGAYQFDDVPAGEYLIVQVQPFEYLDVSEVDGGADGDVEDNGIRNSIPVIVAENENDMGNDFVEKQAKPTAVSLRNVTTTSIQYVSAIMMVFALLTCVITAKRLHS